MRIDMRTVFGIVSSIILHKIWYNGNSIMFEHPEANETEEQIIHQINYRIKLHWLTMFRLSKPKSKKRLIKNQSMDERQLSISSSRLSFFIVVRFQFLFEQCWQQRDKLQTKQHYEILQITS